MKISLKIYEKLWSWNLITILSTTYKSHAKVSLKGTMCAIANAMLSW